MDYTANFSEVESTKRIAQLIEKNEINIKNGRYQQGIPRPMYALYFESLFDQYLPIKFRKKCFRNRTRYKSNKTYNKLAQGEYACVEKIDNRILLRVALGLLITKEECFDLFYVCNKCLYSTDKEMKCINDILDELEIKEDISNLDENEKFDYASDRIQDAELMYQEEMKKSIFINDKIEEEDNRMDLKYLE